MWKISQKRSPSAPPSAHGRPFHRHYPRDFPRAATGGLLRVYAPPQPHLLRPRDLRFPDLEDRTCPRRGPSRRPPVATLDVYRVPPYAPTSAPPPAPPPVDCFGQCHGHGSQARHSERGRIQKMGESPSREAFAAPQCPHGRCNAGEIRGRVLGGRWCRRAGRGRTGGEVVIV